MAIHFIMILALKNISVCLLNVRNLVTNIYKKLPVFAQCTKLDDIRAHILYEHVPDILSLNEIWLSDCLSDSDIDLEGYKLFCNDRQSHGGQVACYVKTSISTKHTYDLEDQIHELLILNLIVNGKSLVMCTWYRPLS